MRQYMHQPMNMIWACFCFKNYCVLLCRIILNGLPYSIANELNISPSQCLRTISSRIICAVFCVPFCLCIAKPPMILLYHRRLSFSIVRFYWFCSRGTAPFVVPPSRQMTFSIFRAGSRLSSPAAFPGPSYPAGWAPDPQAVRASVWRSDRRSEPAEPRLWCAR